MGQRQRRRGRRTKLAARIMPYRLLDASRMYCTCGNKSCPVRFYFIVHYGGDGLDGPQLKQPDEPGIVAALRRLSGDARSRFDLSARFTRRHGIVSTKSLQYPCRSRSNLRLHIANQCAVVRARTPLFMHGNSDYFSL